METSNTPTITQSLLTAVDMARVLNVSRATSHKLLRQGALPSVRIGRVVRVKQDDLQAFIAASTIGKSTSDKAASASAGITAPGDESYA